MGSRQKNDLLKEIARNRRIFYRELNAEYKQTADRLLVSYRRRAKNIQDDLGLFIGAINRGEPLMVELDRLRREAIRELGTMSRVLQEESRRLQQSGARKGFTSGIQALERGGVNIGFNMPNPRQIEAAVNYVDLPAFQDNINRYGSYYGNAIADEILAAVARGENPILTANNIAVRFGRATNQPLASLENMTRTVHLWSARKGTQETYKAVGTQQWVWSSAADRRTCPACWASHGSVHPVTDILNDHHRGRCAMTPVTPQWSELLGVTGYDSPPEISGAELFKNLTDDEQRRVLGKGRYEAYKDGAFTMDNDPKTGIITTYNDLIYGTMIRPKTLQQIAA